MEKTVILYNEGSTVAALSPADKTKALSSTSKIAVRPVFDKTTPVEKASLYIECPGFDSKMASLENAEISIGRDEACGVVLPIGSVSRNHAKIKSVNSEYAVEDTGSTNGTFVNNIKIKKCVLRNNDIIRVGDAKIVFLINSGS